MDIESVEGKLKTSIPLSLKQPAKFFYNHFKLSWYRGLTRNANGLMSPQQYKEIYDCAYGIAKQSNLSMIEIGAAHGATTISLVKGIEDANSESKVYTVDRMKGGSREKYGNVEENEKIFKSNIKKYDLSNKVELIKEDMKTGEEIPSKLRKAGPYSLIVIDADARIYRDFDNFYNLMENGSIIIVDDYSPIERSGKKYETYGYISYFRSKKYIEKLYTVNNLFIGTKPLHAGDIEVQYDEIKEIQRKMSEYVSDERLEFI
jgi:predicted O-methyltransferase YrrM